MKRYENNMADQALIVGSIKVLDNIEGGGFTEIRRDVNAIRQQQNVQNKIQERYWEALSNDGIVSAVEKQGLLREFENITRSEAAIIAQATTLGYQGEILQDYIATYGDLHDYLYITLKLFDNMAEDTAIDNRDTFNTKFSQYYFEENFVLLAITAGILDQLNFRVLQSLNESGTEGETAIYRGGIYQYVDGAWKSVTTGAYKGPHDTLPESEEGAFFIVSDSFTMTDVLYVNDEEFYVNGDTLGITHTYLKGMIYYCKEGVWYVEENESDWKYAAAFADVINITGELPGLFQDAIDDLQEQIDDQQDDIAAEIAAREGQYTIINGQLVQITADLADVTTELGTKISHLPVYYGPQSSDPSNPKEGDFYCYTGGTTSTRITSYVYVYRSGTWVGLDPRYADNRYYYMLALEDVLSTTAVGPGFFSTIFANAFFANSATMESLSVRTIYLHSNGIIQSDLNTYSPESTGLKIDAAGNIDANQNTHLKGKVAIGVALNNNTDFDTYDVVIGGNAKIAGHLDGATGTFSGALSGATGSFSGNGDFRGDLHCGFNEELYNYALAVYDQLTRINGKCDIGGFVGISGFLMHSFETITDVKLRAYHPTTKEALSSMFALVASDIDDLMRLTLSTVDRNRIFSNNNYNNFHARGIVSLRKTITGGYQNIKLNVTGIGIYRLNNIFLYYMGMVYGYDEETGTSYHIYFNTVESKLQIIEMRKSGNSAYDDGYTVAYSDIGEILYTAIIVH